MIKLICVTWSFEKTFDIEKTILFQSFIKKNNRNSIVNIHFDRNEYLDLETEFKNNFGHQYEFLLYRIFLLKEKLNSVDSDFLIFSDTDDVVCLDNIETLILDSDKIIFSSERHRYPNESQITSWLPKYQYSSNDNNNQTFLNAGLSTGKKEIYLKLLNECIENIFPLNYKNFGGDQGVYTYYYINVDDGLILLDRDNKFFLSTYCDSYENYYFSDERLICLRNNNKPTFIHDNGWNYGSPKFINYFKLI